MKLTELAIKHLKPKKSTYRIGDGGGLYISVTPSGGKLWIWRYRFNDKEQMLSIGKYPTISLSEARKRRDAARVLVESGKHPTREKKAEKLRRKLEAENTLELIARKWFSLKDGKLNDKYHRQNLERLEQLVFPSIGNIPVSQITIPEVVNVIQKIGNRGTIETAKRMKQLLNQIFRYAAQCGLCEKNPASDLRDILPSKVKQHHACLPIEEIPDLLKAIDHRKEDYSKYAMQLLSLTFVRTGELIGGKWVEFFWNEKEWHIPPERMKMKRPHVVPLSSQAITVLMKLKEYTGNTPYLFYSPASKSKHISNGTVLMALRRMGYEKRMTGHGFRTLASTILNERGYGSDIIERQLAHEDGDKIRLAYNRAEYLPQRHKMMQDYADILDGLKSIKKGQVIRLTDITNASLVARAN